MLSTQNCLELDSLYINRNNLFIKKYILRADKQKGRTFGDFLEN